ncbi:MAG: trypsin-like serine protease [Pseudomonadota bacterium]
MRSFTCSLLVTMAMTTTACPWLNISSGDAGEDAGPTDALAQLCEGPRKSLAHSPWWVVNGTREPTLVPLTSGQKNAVVSVWNGSGCSGTLIAPRVVLTAKHCTSGLAARDFSILFGQDDLHPLLSVDVTQLHQHSSRDLSLLVLDRDPTQLIDVDPVPIHVDAMDRTWVGERVEAAGYGLTSPYGSSSDGRFFVAEPVYNVDSEFLSINGEGQHGVCFGDSGGPVIGIVPGNAVRVLGALSYGDSSCTGIDSFTRVDPVASWIEGIAGSTPPIGPVPCGSVDVVGRCEAEQARAVYCGGSSELVRDDCSSSGHVCGWDTQAQGFRCIASGTDPCQGTDALGHCDGSTSLWCVRGELRSLDCAQCSMLCTWVNDSIGNDCVDDPCAGLTYQGRCRGDLAEWCNNGTPQSVDCAQYGQTCGWVSDEIGFYCMD